MMTARFEDVVEADEIGINVRLGIVNRVAHACLSGEIHDDTKLILCEETLNEGSISEIATNESEAPVHISLSKHSKSVFLNARVVIAVNVVEANNLPTTTKQLSTQKRTDKASGTGHENPTVFAHEQSPNQLMLQSLSEQ